MPFRYANESDVLANLREGAANTALLESLYRIENALADVFDHKVGRSFGEAAYPSTRSIAASSRDGVLVLARPARAILAVSHGGTYSGGVWVAETIETGWHERYGHDGLVYGIERVAGFWSPVVRVSAIWGDDPEAFVPDDIAHALTIATIKQYRRETSTPNSDLLGPEGFAVPAPDPWNDATVKAVIDKYRVVEVIV